MKQDLIALVMATGNRNDIDGTWRLVIDTDRCLVSWTYWDDNDDEMDDDDGYVKVLYGLSTDGRGGLTCKWDGNFAEAYDSLEAELQQFMYDSLMAWAAELTDETTR